MSAFLEILSINKQQHDMDRHQPTQLDSVGEARNVDSSFDRWAAQNPRRWSRYQSALAAEGRTFDDVFADHGLERNEIFPEGEQ